jgi:hypothetical protein
VKILPNLHQKAQNYVDSIGLNNATGYCAMERWKKPHSSVAATGEEHRHRTEMKAAFHMLALTVLSSRLWTLARNEKFPPPSLFNNEVFAARFSEPFTLSFTATKEQISCNSSVAMDNRTVQSS